MSKVLLDTDILSEILKGKSAVVTAKAEEYLTRGAALISGSAAICSAFCEIGRSEHCRVATESR